MRVLTGAERRELHTTLLRAFPTRAALEPVVSFGLNQSLESITTAEDLSSMILKLLTWAEARDLLPKLLQSALQENPTNGALQALAGRWGAPAPRTPGPPPAALLDDPRLQQQWDALLTLLNQLLHDCTLPRLSTHPEALSTLRSSMQASGQQLHALSGELWARNTDLGPVLNNVLDALPPFYTARDLHLAGEAVLFYEQVLDCGAHLAGAIAAFREVAGT